MATSIEGCAGRSWGAAAAAVALAIATVAVAPAAAQTRLTAEDAARIALERNPTLLSSEASLLAASGSKLAAQSPLMPQLSGRLGYAITDQGIRIDQPGEVNIRLEDETTSGSLSLSQRLFDVTAWNNNQAAGHLETAARSGYQASRADIAVAAYRQFYAFLKQLKLHTVALQALQLTHDQLRRTQALFELGSVARGDVLKQQLQVSRAELDEITARKLILVERARLARLLGMGAGEPLVIDTTLTAGSLDVDSAAVVRDAMQNRPELADLRARVASAGENVSGAKGLRYPTLGASGDYSFNTLGVPDQWSDVDGSAVWTGRLNMGIPIFDGLSAKGRIREAEARHTQAEYAQRQKELDVIVEVEEALQLASQSSERIRVTTDALAVAEEDLKLSQERYNVGSSTVIELIDAQVALTRARSEHVSALADFRYALANLRRARGERF
jgi:outer membrane protein TolC